MLSRTLTITAGALIAIVTTSFFVPSAKADHLGRVRFCPVNQFWLPDGPQSATGTCVVACPNGLADDFPPHCALPPVPPPTATVSGVKWNDLDGDGVKDISEPGLPGWGIELRCNSSGWMTATTDESGEYAFTEILAPDSCTVAEVAQQGWVPTTPDEVALLLAPGSAVIVNFGNATPEGLIQNLIQQVEELVAIGALNLGNGTALIQKLLGASSDLEKSNTNGACGKLGAFINQVEALVSSGHLDVVNGQALIDAATVIREAIPC